MPEIDTDDKVLRLREWGTNRFRSIPCHQFSEQWLLGTSTDCAFQVMDQLSAPRHAQLMREGERWWIRDLGTPEGLRWDGVPCRECLIVPGSEIGIGGTILVAESTRMVALREFVQRLLGWGDDRLQVVDHALRAIRQLVARRSPLIVRGGGGGDGDLVPIAETLHRLALGDAAPFVVCDPRRGNTPASVRAAMNYSNGVEAFTSAIGGSICIQSGRLPPDVDELIQLLFASKSDVRLFVCSKSAYHYQAIFMNSMVIELPSLKHREAEIPRIIEEFGADALSALNAPPRCFTDDERRWVMRHSAGSIPEIAKGTLRLVALNMSPTARDAAQRLGMACVSLLRWIGRRGPLPHPRAIPTPS